MDYQRVFVDGHSVIYAWPELSQLHKRSPQHAREQLLSLLIKFQDALHVPLTIVFDGGRRAKKSAEPNPPSAVEVLYSEPGETADAVIERRVAARERGMKVLVITNDRVEQLIVEGFGAETMSAASFADWVERESRQFGRRLEVIHKEARKYQKLR